MRRMTVISIAIAILATACSGAGSPELTDVWARTSANMQEAGAVYMTITGGSNDDSLIGVAVDSTVAARAELHETTMHEGEDGSEMMMMSPLASIAVPAGDDVVFEPGGYHVMLFELTEPLVTGAEFTLTLDFEKAGNQAVTAEVRDG